MRRRRLPSQFPSKMSQTIRAPARDIWGPDPANLPITWDQSLVSPDFSSLCLPRRLVTENLALKSFLRLLWKTMFYLGLPGHRQAGFVAPTYQCTTLLCQEVTPPLHTSGWNLPPKATPLLWCDQDSSCVRGGPGVGCSAGARTPDSSHSSGSFLRSLGEIRLG